MSVLDMSLPELIRELSEKEKWIKKANPKGLDYVYYFYRIERIKEEIRKRRYP